MLGVEPLLVTLVKEYAPFEERAPEEPRTMLQPR
jgi:hypothetical protein